MKVAKVTPKKTEKIVEVVTEEVVTVEDTEGGPVTLLNKNVVVMCTSYIWNGKLTGVNDKFIELTDPYLVYETGPWTSQEWRDAQKIPSNKIFVMLAQIETIFERNR